MNLLEQTQLELNQESQVTEAVLVEMDGVGVLQHKRAVDSALGKPTRVYLAGPPIRSDEAFIQPTICMSSGLYLYITREQFSEWRIL